MSKLKFDFVVVGAGVVGSWTAKQLVKCGKVLLLEQFREPHIRGSSHGQSRLIRFGYVEQCFADLMPQAYSMWRQLEAESKEKLIEITGALCVADSTDNKDFIDLINNMKRLGPENLVELTCADVKAKYPTTLKYDEKCGVIFDKIGGIVFASKAVKTLQNCFQNAGGVMWDCCRVTDIVPEKDSILIKTCKSDVVAKSLVVTSGAWTKQLISKLGTSLPLEAQAVKVHYWKEKEKGAYSAESGFPAVLDLGHPSIYALPSFEYPGYMKVCLHCGTPCDPDERDKAVIGKDKEEIVSEYVAKHFPLLEPKPSIIETCMYTCTPDEIFLIDRLPGHTNIVFGSGFSGTGFKTSPAVGRLLSELARGVKPFLDVSPFSLSRFANSRNEW